MRSTGVPGAGGGGQNAIAIQIGNANVHQMIPPASIVIVYLAVGVDR
jgi:hypothetical protein